MDKGEEKLLQEERCRSNDTHVIALAQISGARLLYSNDKDLHVDFKNKRLIDEPRGKIYSTNEDKGFHKLPREIIKRQKSVPKSMRCHRQITLSPKPHSVAWHPLKITD